ncbi:MAG: (Fe-S)-binding protein [Deltaproteobacteria bacterium]|nr:(Fe-S)-binding protein [Deltaproteobacteria bacterium]
MAKLKFNENVCNTCPTADCLVKCQYMKFDRSEAHDEMMKIVRGEDSRVLHDCVTCYACEEYCPRGAHPYYLISERREEKAIYTAPRPITNQWINMTQMQGKPMIGAVSDKALSCCFIPALGELGSGEIFKDVASAMVLGAEFMCPAVHTHFARMSVVKERLPKVVNNFVKLGVKEVICLHDECYGTYTSIAPAYGIDVPFKPVYYMDFLLKRLNELKNQIKPLNIKAAYQRPCSNRLIPNKHHLVKEILHLIGVELPDRKYQDGNALCCGEMLRAVAGYKVANDIQQSNIQDMLEVGTDYCVFNCPACQTSLSEKVSKRGLKPVHIIDLCKMAIGENKKEVGGDE